MSFPTDQPIIPIINIIPSTFQHTPVVNVYVREVQPYVPTIAGHVANIAGVTAGNNSARMLTYNTLVNNYWQNREFTEAVQLAVDLYTLGMADRLYHTPDQGMADAADKALRYITCLNISTRYPGLKSLCPPQTLSEAAQTTMEYSNILNRITQAFGVSNVQPQFQPQYQQPMAFQPQQPNVYQQQPTGQVGYNGSNRVFGNTNGVTAPSSTTTPMLSSKWNDVNPPTPPSQDLIRQDVYFNPPTTTTTPEVQPEVIMQTTTLTNIELIKTRKLFNNGETEMDRAKHSIKLIGDTYTVNNTARYEAYIQSAEQLAATRPIVEPVVELSPAELDSDVDKELLELYNEALTTPEVHVSIHPHVIIDNTLDEAIMSSRLKQLSARSIAKNNKDWHIYRTFNIVSNPIFNQMEASNYMEIFKAATSLSELADKVRYIAMGLTVHQDANHREDMIPLLNQLDVNVTTMINEFLKYELNVVERIDSFVGDYAELLKVMEQNHNFEVVNSLKIFEDSLMESVFKVNLDSDNIPALDVPEGVVVNTLPVPYSVTLVNLTAVELGLVADELTQVLYSDAPTLHKLINSLKQHKKDIGMQTYRDLLVTSDGIRYMIGNSAVSDVAAIRKL